MRQEVRGRRYEAGGMRQEVRGRRYETQVVQCTVLLFIGVRLKLGLQKATVRRTTNIRLMYRKD